MSDNIPLEIQMDIIQRIPDIEWVIRCRSVSKAWKSMIDNKDFVTAHTLLHQANDRQAKPLLLIRKRDLSDKQVKYVSIVDDDTFPHQKVSVFVADSVERFSSDSDSINRFSDNLEITATSHGLLCFYQPVTSTAVIWNPLIRKTVATVVPNVLCEEQSWTVVGFGVCPRNLDPKLVKITYFTVWSILQDVNASTQVEVFTLSSGGTWRRPLSSNLPHKSIGFGNSQAVVDGFIYWVSFDRINVDKRFTNPKLIMSFDLTNEEFTKVNLPDPLALEPRTDLSLSNLKESLAVLEFHIVDAYRRICHVWIMIGHSCTRSFNKLYSINTSEASIRKTLGFLKNGSPIIQVDEDKEEYDFRTDSLAIYEPESKNITYIGIDGLKGTFFVHSYKETLLLLDY